MYSAPVLAFYGATTWSATAADEPHPFLTLTRPVAEAELSNHPVDVVTVSSYRANPTIEDRHSGHVVGDKVMVNVFDGHGGWQTSDYVSKNLGRIFATELTHHNDASQEDPEQVYHALKRAYLRTDRELMAKMSAAYKLGFLTASKIGSCSISLVVSPRHITVANAGDCRAVLGQARGGKVTAVELSTDHSANSKAEQARLTAEHPGELNAVVCKHGDTSCYVKGYLQPTRSFGDFFLKYPEFNTSDNAPHDVYYRRVRRLRKYTPPYITAEPEILTRDLDLSKDSFVILASDGLWDFVASEEAVDVIANYSGDRAGAAAALAEYSLTKAAMMRGGSLEDLLLLDGKARRNAYDDITVMVVYLDKPEVRARRLEMEALPKEGPEQRPAKQKSWLSRLLGW